MNQGFLHITRKYRLDIYRTEEEQVATLKRWLKQNGLPIATGVVLGLGGLGSWHKWKEWRLEQSSAASALYQKALIATRTGDSETMRTLADEIVTDYDSTTYGAFASLLIAKSAVDAGNLDEAVEKLNWVAEHYSQPQLQHIVRLRLIRLHLAQKDLVQAEELLATAEEDMGEFKPRYIELRGDLHILQGLLEQARAQWQQALDMYKEGNELLQLKIDGLGSKPEKNVNDKPSATS
ncbi:MAG: YfgM family protein [Candidatus Eutrophobiaceae bacterium]